MITLFNKHNVNFKLDTGAEVLILNYLIFKRLNIPLHKCDILLVDYNNRKIETLGTCEIECSTLKVKNVKLTFIVCKNRPSIIGGDHCELLGLIKRVDQVSDENHVKRDKLINKYKDVFSEDLSKPSNNVKIELKVNKDAIPVAELPRRIPDVLHDRLRNTLLKHKRNGVISEVTEPCEWVHNLVISEKPNKELRLCLDPRNLNRSIVRNYHLIPRPEDLINNVKNHKFFTVLDCQHVFYQMELTEKSSFYCVFNTPFGKYKFNRLPQGISNKEFCARLKYTNVIM